MESISSPIIIKRNAVDDAESARDESSGRKRTTKEIIEEIEESYDNIIIDCFRYLGCASLKEVHQMTLNEYSYRMLAYRLSVVDKDENDHKQAWLNVTVNNEKEVGSGKNKKRERIFKNFTDFYDKEKEIDKILNVGQQHNGHKKEVIKKKKIETTSGFDARKAARMAAKLNRSKG